MRQTPTELTAAEPRAGRVRLFPFSYARFATKQQECLDENSEAEVECWKPGRAVSRVSPRLIVRRSRESTNGTPVVISLTTADLIAYFEKERQEEESRGWNAQLCDSMTLFETGQYGDNFYWMFVSLGFSFWFQARRDDALFLIIAVEWQRV